MEVMKYMARSKSPDGGNQKSSRIGAVANRFGFSLSNRHRPPPLVTSSTFDKDDKFVAIAKALFSRYEEGDQTKRQAIEATLITTNERQAFLESLELRNAQISIDEYDDIEELTFLGLIRKTASVFGDDLKALWRDSVIEEDGSPSINVIVSSKCSKTPMSPRNISAAARNSSLTHPNMASTKPSSSKSRHQRFFADSGSLRSKRSLRFDFRLGAAEPVRCLQLDGTSPLARSRIGYQPPSPSLHVKH